MTSSLFRLPTILLATTSLVLAAAPACTSDDGSTADGGAGGTGAEGGAGGQGGVTSTGGAGGAAPACGDGVIDADEDCDDGNDADVDGCSSCAVDAGYTCDGEPSACADVDECADAPCDANATCTNTEGAFECACNAGYAGDGETCSDVDECSDGLAMCDALATCANTDGAFTCACPPGTEDSNGDGTACTTFTSCAAILAALPNSTDGAHTIDPDGAGAIAPFEVYCDMTHEGGGWTLLFNETHLTFDDTNPGTAGTLGYMAEGTSLAFSTVPIVADIMFDVSDSPLSGANQSARSTVTGVHANTAGQTLFALLASNTLGYVEAQGNTNVSHVFATGFSCTSWTEYLQTGLCGNHILTLNDLNKGCGAGSFSFGVEKFDYTPHGNCAGWPESANTQHWPDNFRVWAR